MINQEKIQQIEALVLQSEDQILQLESQLRQWKSQIEKLKTPTLKHGDRLKNSSDGYIRIILSTGIENSWNIVYPGFEAMFPWTTTEIVFNINSGYWVVVGNVFDN